MKEKAAPCPLGARCEYVEPDKEGEPILFRCPWFAKIRGKDPQSEEVYDEWRCSIQWLPILLVENSRKQHSTGAAVESFRNTMAEGNRGLALLMAGHPKGLDLLKAPEALPVFFEQDAPTDQPDP